MVVVKDDAEELRLLETRLLLDAGILLEDPGRVERKWPWYRYSFFYNNMREAEYQ